MNVRQVGVDAVVRLQGPRDLGVQFEVEDYTYALPTYQIDTCEASECYHAILASEASSPAPRNRVRRQVSMFKGKHTKAHTMDEQQIQSDHAQNQQRQELTYHYVLAIL